ncbi:hypothetical protein GCM10027193_01050 [Arenimonas aestuarii]
MDLLCVLAAHRGQVVPREDLMQALWPGVVVGDDSLARTVSKLRQALGDDARSPAYLETISKRGYRLIAEDGAVASAVAGEPAAAPRPAGRLALVAVLLAVALGVALVLLRDGAPTDAGGPAASPATDTRQLISRADDYYFRYSRADNEAALELYQRVLGLDPDNADAMAGLANALAQRAIRWPTAPTAGAVEYTRLGDALAAGHLSSEPARSQLVRARQLAEAAVARAPASSAAHRALGLVASAQGELDAGLAAHRRAVELDPAAWGAMINIADVLELVGRDEEALAWFERAFETMAGDYDTNPAKVGAWHASLGVLVAERHRARGDSSAAEAWYRRVLAISPLQPEATRGLAGVLADGGDAAAAERLCRELEQRLGQGDDCP